jgi:hypothetical protein
MDVESDEDYVDATGMSGISTSFDKKKTASEKKKLLMEK